MAAVEAAIALIETGVEDAYQASGIKTYPNPVTNQLFVDIHQAAGLVAFELFDMQGRRLFHEQWNASGESIHSIDVSLLSTGFYFYQVSNGDEFLQGKLVKS